TPHWGTELLISPDDISEHATSTYSHQFRKRDISFSSIHDMSPFWQKIYEPMTQNEQAFNEVLNDIDDKEWDTILNSLQRLIRDAFNLVLITGHIPSKWKSSTIIPILKPEKFNYNMDNFDKSTYPTGLKIALQRLSLPNRLIDLVIRIFTNRNAQILTAFGPTPSFIAGDRVDQGDSLSPLIWRIFRVVRENNLELELHKVKGHSGDEWNDKVDAPELANIELVYLPPNTTTHLQPMDAGIIHSFKVKYKQKFCKYLIHQFDS
ncbi:13806_t:CDS:2, partial [Rhizophagus irregularis]